MPKESELAGHVLSNIRIEPIDPLSFWLLSHTEWCRQMLSWCELSLCTPTSRIQQLAPFKATLMNIEIYVYCYSLIIIGATFLLMWIKSKLFYNDLCGQCYLCKPVLLLNEINSALKYVLKLK